MLRGVVFSCVVLCCVVLCCTRVVLYSLCGVSRCVESHCFVLLRSGFAMYCLLRNCLKLRLVVLCCVVFC